MGIAMTFTLMNGAELIAAGIFATATLDLWALGLNRAFGLPITNWGHVGRWVSLIPAGSFRHTSIAAVPPVAYERAVGWTTHYVIGVAYAGIYWIILAATSSVPSVYSAGLFGLATLPAPWLILQPCLGMGRFASNTPRPNLTRALNTIAHLVFGIGLFLGWSLFNALT